MSAEDKEQKTFVREGAEAPGEPRGSIVRTIYSVRTMKSFAVHENDLEELSLINVFVVVFFSIGSAFLTWGIDIFIGLVGEEAKSPVEQIMYTRALPVLIFLSLVFFCLGIRSIYSRRTRLRKIKEESEFISGEE